MPPPAPVSRQTPAELIGRQYHEMRAHILSLAADFDRIDRSDPPPGDDPRLTDLRRCLHVVIETGVTDRAERVQMLLSDHSPGPQKNGNP